MIKPLATISVNYDFICDTQGSQPDLTDSFRVKLSATIKAVSPPSSTSFR